MNYIVSKKPITIESNSPTIMSPSDVYNLDEIKEIKDAIQEHLIYIGLDRANHIRNIEIVAIGNADNVSIDIKFLVRKALINANEGVIIVHNHPSNSLEPSAFDKKFTEAIQDSLGIFNVRLLDHIIVTENDYTSMKSKSNIIQEYKKRIVDISDYKKIVAENKELKNKIKSLEAKLRIRDRDSQIEME